MTKKLTIALPKGRILKEFQPLLKKVGIIIEEAFNNPSERKLKFSTNIDNIEIIRVRSFDVATFVAFGAAQMGVAGNDVLEEFDFEEIYAPVDLKIGKCTLSTASLKGKNNRGRADENKNSHIKIASKYPNITKRYFENKGIGTEIIKLSGAMELAPNMGICSTIVDLVSTGRTLKDNNLVRGDDILAISSRLIVNKTAFKTRTDELQFWIDKFRAQIND